MSKPRPNVCLTQRSRESVNGTLVIHSPDRLVASRLYLRSCRCHRLKKQCFLTERPPRKRTRTSKPTYVPSPIFISHATNVMFRRVAQLEQKLDGLVTLLKSNQSTLPAYSSDQTPGVSLPKSPVSLESNVSTARPSTTAPQSIISDEGITAVHISNGIILPNGPVGSATNSNFSIEPDDEEADLLLLEFKTNMAEQFPFVVIAPQSSTQSLKYERPLLWKAIMVAASHQHLDRQLALGSKLMDDLMTRLLLRPEKSLDLLQALLIFIAWYGLRAL